MDQKKKNTKEAIIELVIMINSVIV